MIARSWTSASGTLTLGVARADTAVPDDVQLVGVIGFERERRDPQDLLAQLAAACCSAPAAAIIVRDANPPVFSGEAPVSPACTRTAS